MEDICTDIIHYEKRDGWTHNKLVNYRGKMSQFVEKQPQAKVRALLILHSPLLLHLH